MASRDVHLSMLKFSSQKWFKFLYRQRGREKKLERGHPVFND